MRYIIEYNDQTKKWKVVMPENRVTDYGTEYTEYTHDVALTLNQAIQIAYIHRATYSNWETSMWVNGAEVLYTKEDSERGRWIHFVDGSTMKVYNYSTEHSVEQEKS